MMEQEKIKVLLNRSLNIPEIKWDLLLKTKNSLGENLEQIFAKKKIEKLSSNDVISTISEHLCIKYLKELTYKDLNLELTKKLPMNYLKKHTICPYRINSSEQLEILTSNPFFWELIPDLKLLFHSPLVFIFMTRDKIDEAILYIDEKRRSSLQNLDGMDDSSYDLEQPVVDLLESQDDEAPVIKLVNALLLRAIKEKASDIHIEPYEKKIMVRFRVDGALYDVLEPPKKIQNAITSRIKIMGNLNIAEKRLPQDGRIPLKVSQKDIDLRLNTIPTTFGERLVMRIQDKSSGLLKLEQLGFPERSVKMMDDILTKTYGIFLVTGPTGSGKTTTLYSSLSRINTIDKNIITVEDPVEQRIEGVGQIQVNSKIGLTFASGLRAILRQDPDIIMLGEIRDLETAEIAINASLTGHLVLSTLHTNDSASVFPRLIDMGCEPFLIATSLLGVLAQRLVRVLCPICREGYQPTKAELIALQLPFERFENKTIYRAKGCTNCNQKGYVGQTVIQELLLITEEVRSLIMQRTNSSIIKNQAIKEGFISFRDDGIKKALSGITSIEEVVTSSQTD